MDKMDQGLKDLIEEVARLIAGALNERMESGEFKERFGEINQRMLSRYGRIIGTMALGVEIVTVPAKEGEKSKKPDLSLNFRFGKSKEDEEMGKLFGLDGEEMNRLLEQARREKIGEEEIPPASKKTVPRSSGGKRDKGERKAAKPSDPRDISRIINSIREIARSLNLEQRLFLAQRVFKTAWLSRLGVITREQVQNDTTWLQSIQELINAIGNEARERGKSREELKKVLLLVEMALKTVSGH